MFHLLQVSLIVAVVAADVLPHTTLLNDGNRIPTVAYGTFGKKQDLDNIKPAVIQAIEAGYRHIDTAVLYENEVQIGEAITDVISRGVVTREELWITTKVNFDVDSRKAVLPALQASLQRLQLDYVDLLLIHSPDNLYELEDYDFLNVWNGLEDVKKMNLVRSIGVSNFNSTHINRVLANSETVPAVNQIEVNPTYASLDLVAYCQSLNITVISYAPFGLMVPRLFISDKIISTFEEPILVQLAEKYGKTTSQIVLRYLIDRGTIPIPRSTNPKHIEINIDVLDFYLTPQEVFQISEINREDKTYKLDQESLFDVLRYYGLV